MKKTGIMDRGMDEKKTIICLIVFALVILALPQLIRVMQGNMTIMGEQPYYHARIAESILDNDISIKDNLVYGGRNTIFTPYHFIVAGAAYAIGIENALRIVPVIFGLISVLLFYLILRRFDLGRFIRIASAVILVMSPAFIYTFSCMQDSMAIMLTLLGIYLITCRKRLLTFLSFLSFLTASLFSIFNSLVIVAPFIVYSLITKKQRKLSIILLVVLAAAEALIYAIKPISFFNELGLTSPNILKEIISDIGGLFGIGIFCFIIAIIGFFYSWKDKRRYYTAYIMMILLLVSFYLVGGFAFAYLNFYLSVFAGIGLFMINEIRWEMRMIKNLTLIIVACGFLFSMISFSVRLADMPPDNNMMNGLSWLKENSKASDIVISHYSNGYLIEYASGRPVLIDDYISSIPEFERKYLDVDSLFYSSELGQAKGIMDKYGVRYIVITEDMKEGLVWDNKNSGLLYLLRNKETFKNIYGSKEIEIWKYLG
ncbi:MAG: hypothetical protein NT001_07400 [Candidatus Woesearchaeota archaeon]|nr:hypothetical protein [Candidatus Woesearchaeota archaeon]